MEKLMLVLVTLVSFFCLTKSSPPCECPPSVYAGQSGVLHSPNYPNNYCPSLTCNYFITVFTGQFVKLTFTDYLTESNYDNIYVYDGDKTDDSANQIARFSGSYDDRNAVFYAGSSKLSVKFVTDGATQMRGFNATFLSVANNCGPTALSSVTGTLQSPNYPNNYPNDVHCLWTITAPPGQVINVTFATGSRTEPNDDVVTITEANGTVLVQLSGTIFPNVTTRGNGMRVLFNSDKNVIMRGFRATYQAYVPRQGCRCQQPTTQSITSPGVCKSLASANFPRPYCENNNCTWYLNVPENFNVQITFSAFSLERNYDYVTIFDGLGATGEPLARCTGNSCPQTVSSSNWMTVRFTTDGSVASTGWSARWCPALT